MYFKPTYESGTCWGAFGIIQQTTRYVATDHAPFFGICSPPNSKRQQLVVIFTEYVARNPQRMHVDFFEVAVEALRVAFLCARR